MRTYMLLLAVLLAIAVQPSNAQVTLQAGAGLGAMVPSGDFGGSTLDYYAGTKYGQSTGVSVHGKARVGLLGFTLVGEVGYAFLSNEGESEPGQGVVEVSQNILTLKAGPEFALTIPLVPVTPYVGANVQLNSFSGETKFQGVAQVPSGTFDLESASRLGFGLTGGVVFAFGGLNLDVGLAYNFMNLSGKEWQDVDAQSDGRIDSYRALNDQKDPLYQVGDDDHFVSGDRSISSFQVTATLMFGL